jgi:membrane peptidoglycan carboxypeptidase
MTNGSGVRNQLDNGARQSAGKTGTSDKNNESWFVGYTPQLVTAVWVGTPDDGNKRMMTNVTIGGQFIPKMHGAAVAAPIWKGIMNRALDGAPRVKFKEPSEKLTKGDEVAVPGVTGMSVEQATAVLEGAGFTAHVGGTMASSVRQGLVAGTSPYGRAPRGSDITIYTSQGGVSRDQGPAPAVQPTSAPKPPAPKPSKKPKPPKPPGPNG